MGEAKDDQPPDLVCRTLADHLELMDPTQSPLKGVSNYIEALIDFATSIEDELSVEAQTPSCRLRPL
jgi:hypothetical protein